MVSEELRSEISKLPFPPILNQSLPMEQFSVRNNEIERPTIRYLLKESGKKYRIKEFFMDWFYTGFPKSLMKTLVGTYSEVSNGYMGEYMVFSGKNYKGNDSASFYCKGTTVEIECYDSARTRDFRKVVEDMSLGEFLTPRFEGAGFRERSFLAGGGSAEWWEDRRIAAMEWKDLTSSGKDVLSLGGLIPISIGYYRGDNGRGLNTAILADRYLERSIWIELFDLNISMEHGYYKFRKHKGLFNSFNDNGHIICFRSPEGPGAFQFTSGQTLATLAFSPGFSWNFLNTAFEGREEIIHKASALFT